MEFEIELARILSQSPADCTESDMAFLQARRAYLTEEQLINFLGQSLEVEATEPAVDAEPKRKTKKSA